MRDLVQPEERRDEPVQNSRGLLRVFLEVPRPDSGMRCPKTTLVDPGSELRDRVERCLSKGLERGQEPGPEHHRSPPTLSQGRMPRRAALVPVEVIEPSTPVVARVQEVARITEESVPIGCVVRLKEMVVQS